MNIVLLGAYPLTQKRSGAVVHVEKLVQYVSTMHDINMHVITIGRVNQQIKKGDVYVHEVTWPLLLASFFFPFAGWSVRSKIKRIHPNVIHACGGFPYTSLAAVLQHKYPSLITVFSLSRKELKFEGNIIRILRKVLVSIPNEMYVIPRIPHIIVQSHFTEKLIKEITKSKIHVVPEGIEYEKTQYFQPQIYLDETPDSFIAVGLRKLKGLDILIKAIPIVLRSLPGFKLYIAGSGEEKDELRNLVIKLGLEAQVKFLGYFSEIEEINRYYRACKIVVVPSRWDVEPFAPLDGAVWGKPSIVSEASNSSLVEDGKTGFVFKSENIGDLAAKIITLLTDDRLREEMGNRAKEKVKEYDWSRIANSTVEVYKEVIADFRE